MGRGSTERLSARLSRVELEDERAYQKCPDYLTKKNQPGRPMAVGPNWFQRDWIEGPSELPKAIEFPEDVQDFRAQQDELAAALSAQTVARRVAKQYKKEQMAEKNEHLKRVSRAWASNSIGPQNEHGDWSSAASANEFFIKPIIDTTPGLRHTKNPLLTSFWDGLADHLPPHHKPNVHGVWNNFGGQNDVGTALGEFGSVAPHRQTPKEKEYSEAVEKRVKHARRVHSIEAMRATCGTYKREDMLAKAEPSSVLKGEKAPWVLERRASQKFFSYVPVQVEPLVCPRVMRQVFDPVRAHDHARQIVSGSAVTNSKWSEPKTKYHGTQRREENAKELLKNHHGFSKQPPPQPEHGVPRASLINVESIDSPRMIRSHARPATAPIERRRGSSRVSSAGPAGRASETNIGTSSSKAMPRAQSASGFGTRPSMEGAKEDVAAALRPQSAMPAPTKCNITVSRPPSSGWRRPGSGGVKPRPRSAAP